MNEQLTTKELFDLLREYKYIRPLSGIKRDLLFCHDLNLNRNTKTLSIVLSDINLGLQNIVCLNDVHEITTRTLELNPTVISFRARLNDSLYSGETFDIQPIKFQYLTLDSLLKNINDNK
jgi:hypothetical protein